MHKEDKNARAFNAFMRDKTEIELSEKEKHGSNNEVFFYIFTNKDQFGLILLKMCFYGGIDIYTSFIPKGVTLPVNLGMELINLGIPTVITLGDKSYEFKKKALQRRSSRAAQTEADYPHRQMVS